VAGVIDPTHLPPNFPEPVDSGACEHLNGLQLPPIELASTTGTVQSLHDALADILPVAG
jgi:NifU-like protein involved in Fe-S cluster formation